MTGVDDRIRRRVAELDAADAERHDPPGGLWDRIAASIEHDRVERPGAVEYAIDRHDVVVAIGGDWDAFAESNEAPELAGSAARTPLWDSIADDQLRDLWRAAVDAVRATGRPASIPFRCDAPDVRRWYRMDLSPGDDGGVHFRSELTFEMERPALEVLRREVPRDDELPTVQVCSWCAKASNGAGWRPIEELLASARLLEADPPPPVSYGICPGCQDEMTEQLVEPLASTRRA